jgi:ketosteroid isomerase-like protein
MIRRPIPLLCVPFLLLACASPRPREALLAADSALSHTVATAGASQGFASFLSQDAVYLEPDTEYIRGRNRIEAFLGARLPATSLRFGPSRAEISADGSVGYIIGWTELTQPAHPVGHGKYIAFWRKQPDGDWRLEAWNRSRAAEGPPAALPALTGLRKSPLRLVDPAAETRALIGVDSAFAAVSVAWGAVQAFTTYAAPTAVSLGGGKDFVVGREAIGREQAGPPGQVLDWRPVLGGVGPLGDLGWTVGTFVFTPAGAPPGSFRGKYLTVWQRADSGSWQFVADGGSGNSPPPDRR